MPFLIGINYPWSVLNGKPIYGCDFGRHIWGGHAGVTTHLDDVRADFEAMGAIGIEVVRWFVFTDGRGGVQWDERGRLGSLDDEVFADLDAALALARDANVRLCLVLFNFSWVMHRERARFLVTADGRAALFERMIDPVLARYGRHGPAAALGPWIHSFDVMNEPDWVTEGLALNRSRARKVSQPFSLDQLRALVRGIADRVHLHTDSLVTVGGARAKFAAEWDDPAYGLDFLQVHQYPNVRRPLRDWNVFRRSYDTLGLTKPLVIGEFPARGDRQHPPDHHPPPDSLTDYLDAARDGGYLGAWPWTFKGVDEFGGVDRDEMKRWVTSFWDDRRASTGRKTPRPTP